MMIKESNQKENAFATFTNVAKQLLFIFFSAGENITNMWPIIVESSAYCDGIGFLY